MSAQSNPAVGGVSVTAHDTTNISYPNSNIGRGLFVGTGGNVVVVCYNDVAITLKNVSSGTILPVAAKRVNATNTTASDIVALY